MSEHVPYLMPDEEPPGRWVENPDLNGLHTWSGTPSWRTRHGPATVEWLLGRPHAVEEALTPEGRLRVETSSPMDQDTWRRRSASLPGGWVHGTLEIGGSDVTFADAPMAAPAPRASRDPTEPPDLSLDLASDGPFLSRLQDIGFASAVYASLCNADFRLGSHPRRWSCTWRSAGAIVSDMRSIGETYIDFYLATWRLADGREPNPGERDALLAEVAAHYARLGWRRLDDEELASDHEAALGDIAAAEALPEAPCPDWASRLGGRTGRGGFALAATAAFTGRLSRESYVSITERLDVGMDAEPPSPSAGEVPEGDRPPSRPTH